MKQVSEHVNKNNLLPKFQSAYRPLHSTETALLRVQNDILRSLDSSKGVILCLLDLSAAFDTIDHEILLSRLQTTMGITGAAINWFRSYLVDRQQRVHVQGVSSSPQLLAYGVPQGSVSGPQDFSYYSSDLVRIAELHDINVHLYADDSQLYLSFELSSPEDADQALKQVEDCILDFRIWMLENKLKLNDDKTEALIILPSRQVHKRSIFQVKVGDCPVSVNTHARNLGIIFDDTLSMKEQINAVVKSCNIQLRSIGNIRKYLSSEAATNLIHAFITSRLDNGNSLLFGLPDYLIEKLQRIQNNAARILTRAAKYEHITPVLQDLHWLPVESRIKFKILLLTFKCLNSLAPEYLSELLNIYQPSRPLRSSNNLNLDVPPTRLKSYGDRSFSKASPLLWNPLPIEIKSSSSLQTFKRKLKHHLFKDSY